MPEDDKEKEDIEIKEDEALATDAATVPLPDEWWRHSAFVIKGDPQTVCVHLRPKKWATFTLFSKICFLLYARRRLKLKGRVLRGLTEWTQR